jgi:serine/threonine-protein kinase
VANSAAPRRVVPTPPSVGRFEVLLPIASGGMATVYLARSRGARGFERHVAIKLSHPHLAEDGSDGDNSSFATMLLDEANLAARIRHKNVVSILDVGEDPNGLFMVMDYVEGDSLSGLLSAVRKQGESLPLEMALRIFLDALAGLHAAHELTDDSGRPLGVVHRDFSPQNILVGLDGVAQLTDFGVAKAIGHSTQTSAGVIKGKVAYMAPEHASGKTTDRRADIWSAGVVLWELIANRRMHPKLEGVALLLKVIQERPPLLRTVVPDVSRELEAVVARALSAAADDRYPTAAAFSTDLQNAIGRSLTVADHAEVGQMVRTLAGPKLAERRTSIEEALRLRHNLDEIALRAIEVSESPTPRNTPLVPPSPPPPPPDRAGEPLSVYLATVPDETAPEVPSDRPRSRSPFIVIGVFGAMMLAAFFAVRFAMNLNRSPSASPATAASLASEPVLTTPGPSGSTTATSPTPETTAAPSMASTLEVVGDAPIVSLRVDERTIALARPTPTVTLTRSDAERGRALKIQAVTADGRKAAALLPADATSLTISFPSTRPTPQPAASGRAYCDPPYTLTPDGVRIPKRQCF